MSYAGLGFDLPPITISTTAGAPAAGTATVPGSTAGYPVAERNAIANAMSAAAIVLGGLARGRTTSAGVIAGQDALHLNNTVRQLRALRPNAGGLVSATVTLALLTLMLRLRPTLGPLVDRQLAARGVALLAPRLVAMATPPPAVSRTQNTRLTVTKKAPVAEKKVAAADDTLAADKKVADTTTNVDTKAAADKVVEEQKVATDTAKVAADKAAEADAAKAKAEATGTDEAKRLALIAQAEAERLAIAAADALAQADVSRSDLEVIAAVTNDVPVQTTIAATTGLGPLGLSWTVWGVGAAVAAVGGYFLMTRKVTPNRRRRSQRNARRRSR